MTYDKPVQALKPCCQQEAQKSLKRHAAVATCDECKALLLGYGNEEDFKKTCMALDEQQVPYGWEKTGDFWVVAKLS